MKLLDSKIFDGVNYSLAVIQNKLDCLKKKSFLLSKLDFFILLALYATFVVSTFAQTEFIGLVSALVPTLVFIKVLITKGEKIELESSNFFLLIYLLICLISNFTSSMLPQSLYGFMKTLIYFAFYFAMCQYLKTNKNMIRSILTFVSIIIVIESFIGLYQNSIGVANISTWQDTSYVNPEDVLSRIYGTLKPYNPNLFAAYLITGFPSVIMLLAFSLKKCKIKSSIVYLLWVLISALAIFLTGCRGAYIAFFIIILGCIFASYQVIFNDFVSDKLRKIWKAVIIFGSVGVIGFLALNHGILHRIMSIFILRGDSSTSFRMNVYNSAIQMFQDNWLFGIGVGNKVFREIYGLYMLSGFDALSCYCVFLEMAVESGVLALLAYLLFLGSLLFVAVRNFVKSNDYNYKVLLFVSFISIVAVMVHGLVDTVYFRPQVQYLFWTMAAILTVLVRKDKVTE